MVPQFLRILFFVNAVNAVFLTRYDTCPDLLTYFHTNALSRVGAYGLGDSRNFASASSSSPCGPIGIGAIGGDGSFLSANGGSGSVVGGSAGISGSFGAGSAVGASASFGGFSGSIQGTFSSTEAPPAPDPVAGVDFSETNVQVDGVDEPDIIKTDGSRVFVVRGRNLFVLRVLFGGSRASIAGKLTLPSTASEMLIEGNNLLVITRTSTSFGFFLGPSSTTIYQVKVTDNIPKLIATLRLDGRYLSSREVDGVARIVTLYRPSISFRTPSCSFGFADAKAHNEDVIRRSTERDWYPSYSLKIEGEVSETSGLISSCSNVYVPGPFSGFELLTVVTLPVSGILKPTGSVSIVSEGDEIYSTESSLYVTTTEYRWDFFGFENSLRSGANFKTSIHKFSLSNYGASYIASGEVSGSVLNQFSMHENKGYFFIATTDGAPWWGARDESSSKVTSFEPKPDIRALQKVGEVGNLGRGERIFAVRYVKETAYVVTFREVDPLYVIDLSKPWTLRVTGDLKIPGFSSYLHPISSGRILGVGQEATQSGRTTGAKVTLFDVSDSTNPSELSSWILPMSTTTAQWDHRAFLYWEPESVAVLPVSTRFGSEQFVGSVVLEISDSNIRERGRVTHSPSSGVRSPAIERNLVIGGTNLWSLSLSQIEVNSIQDLSKTSSTNLPR